jgi:DNA-binding transcriptional ArsR family regulator
LDALIPKTRQAILAATFQEPRRWWYMRELARHLHLTPSTLQRELDSLVRGGILRQRREGKHVYFQPAADSPIFEELQGLLLKTAGLADVIRKALEPFTDRIQWAFIYGSMAKAEEHATSDVDLMLIGRVGLAEVSSPLRKVEQRLNRPVNPTIYTSDQFAGKVKANQQFISGVMRSKKIFLLGNIREFDRTFGR